MIEKAIDDWLTKTTERNYLPALCQVLMHQGHQILYVSTHGLMERGKDIATVGPDGEYYAYQTKTGDINKSAWRKDKGEFQELIEYPIDHPSVDKSKVHRAFLVTNGVVNEPVRLDITAMNEQNANRHQRWAKLEIVDHALLLNWFTTAHQHFFPRELPDVRSFLDLYLHDGAAMLPKDKFAELLEHSSFGLPQAKASDARDAITASVILTSYMLAAFEHAKNWYALVEGWWMLAAAITRHARRHSLPVGDWEASYRLALRAIDEYVKELIDEAEGKQYWLELPIETDGDDLLRARTTMMAGMLGWSAMRADSSQSFIERVKALVLAHDEHLWFWGESAFPFFFQIVRFLEVSGEEDHARRMLRTLFTALVDRNYKGGQGFWSPYYDVERALGDEISDQHPPELRPVPGASYLIRSVLDMLLRRNDYDVIRQFWRKYTYVQHATFRPDREEDSFAWRTPDGTNATEFPRAEDSIARLRHEALEATKGTPFLRNFRDVLGLHLMVFPFRVTPETTGLLDHDSRQEQPNPD